MQPMGQDNQPLKKDLDEANTADRTLNGTMKDEEPPKEEPTMKEDLSSDESAPPPIKDVPEEKPREISGLSDEASNSELPKNIPMEEDNKSREDEKEKLQPPKNESETSNSSDGAKSVPFDDKMEEEPIPPPHVPNQTAPPAHEAGLPNPHVPPPGSHMAPSMQPHPMQPMPHHGTT